MKKLLFSFFHGLQVHHLMRYLLRSKVIILCYHGVTHEETIEGIKNYDGKHLSVKKFEAQLKYLKKYYHVISLEDYIQSRLHNRKLPPSSVILTFDDGYESNYSLAFPLLKKYALPATIFLTTQSIQNKEFLWTDRIEYAMDHAEPRRYEFTLENERLRIDLGDSRNGSRVSCVRQIKQRLKNLNQETIGPLVQALEDVLGHRLSQEENPSPVYRLLQEPQILEMAKSPWVSLGSHTHRHRILSRCQPETAKRELLESKEWIESRTGQPCDFFCYPNGEEGDFNLLTKQLVKETRHQCALTGVEGFNDSKTDLFELKRLGVGNQGDAVEFSMTLCGIKKGFSDLKRIIRRGPK